MDDIALTLRFGPISYSRSSERRSIWENKLQWYLEFAIYTYQRFTELEKLAKRRFIVSIVQLPNPA